MKIRLSIYNGPNDLYADMIYNHFLSTTNFTEKSHCVSTLASSVSKEGTKIYPNNPNNDILTTMIDSMGKLYRGDALMTAKWLRFITKRASSETVIILTDIYTDKHEFSSMVSKTTPNHLYALVNSFTLNPYVHQIESRNDGTDGHTFHHAPGYKYITDCVIDIDTKNHNVASRISEFFTVINNLSPRHQVLMRQCIDRILSTPNISENVKEILGSC